MKPSYNVGDSPSVRFSLPSSLQKLIPLLSLVAFVCALFLGLTSGVESKPLTRALVRKTINQVYYYPSIKKKTEPDQAVAGKTIIQGDDALRTGRNSRSELFFNDRSIARVGSNAVFSFVQGTRKLNLADGTMLMQVPKNSKKTTIRTAAATAAITGTTVMMEHQPNSHVKMITLEGTMNVSIPARPGESRTLNAGQMLLFPPDAQRLPEPVTIDLKRLKETSKLINGFEDDEGEDDGEEPSSDPEGETEEKTEDEGSTEQTDDGTGEGGNSSEGPETSDPGNAGESFSTKQIDQQIQQQGKLIQEGVLEPTNLVIKGEGTEVNLEDINESPVPEDISETTEDQETNEEAKETQTKETTVTEIPTISGDQPFELTGTTQFDLSANPTVTINPTFDGFLYRGEDQGAPDPSQFLFGGPSSFDNATGLDDLQSDFSFISFAGAGAASFKFSQFNLNGLPAVQRSSEVTSLALISEGSTGIGALPDVPALFLGTQNGNMTVDLPIGDVPSSTDLFFYARGSGSTLDLTMSFNQETTPEMRTGDLLAASQGDLTLRPGSSYFVTGEDVSLFSNQTLILDRPSEASGGAGIMVALGGDLRLRSNLSDGSQYGIQTQGSFGVPNLFFAPFPTNDSIGSLTLRTAGSKIGLTDVFMGFAPSSFDLSPGLSTGAGAPSTPGDARVESSGGDIQFSGFTALTMPGGKIVMNSGGGNLTLTGTNLPEADFFPPIASLSTVESNLGQAGEIRLDSRGGALEVTRMSLFSFLIDTSGEAQMPEPGSGGPLRLDSGGGPLTVSGGRMLTMGGEVSFRSGGGPLQVLPGSPFSIAGGSVDLRSDNTITITGPSTSPYFGTVMAFGGPLSITAQSATEPGLDFGGTIHTVTDPLTELTHDVNSLFLATPPDLSGTTGDLTLETAGGSINLQNLYLGFLPLSLIDEASVIPDPQEEFGQNLPLPSSSGRASLDSNGGDLTLSGNTKLAMPGGNISVTTEGGALSLSGSTNSGENVSLESSNLEGSGMSQAGALQLSSGNGNLSLFESNLLTGLFESTESGPNPIYGTGGDVNVSTNQGNISVEESEIVTHGGDVNITSEQGSIQVRNSTDIHSIVQATADGGQITVRTHRGTVTLQGSSSDFRIRIENRDGDFNPKGTLLVESGESGSSSDGSITVGHAQLRASLLKMRAHGPNGELLITDDSVLSASDRIKLYASGSSGRVVFSGQVELQGPGVAQIAGNTVRIEGSSSQVIMDNIGASNVEVYANHKEYAPASGAGDVGAFVESSSPTSPGVEKSFSERPNFNN